MGGVAALRTVDGVTQGRQRGRRALGLAQRAPGVQA